MSIWDDLASAPVKNAVARAKKRRLSFAQNECTQIGLCGGWVDTPSGKKRKRTAPGNTTCIACALTHDLKVAVVQGSDPEGDIAEQLGVDRNWVLSLIQGWDGDPNYNGEGGAYRLGQKLWRDFGG
jgi:hypothetical protein